MARTYERYGTRIKAMDSYALTADTLPADGSLTLVQVNLASGQNADGAQWFDVYADVTAAPSTAATCELWVTGSSDGTDESAYEYALSCAVPTTVDQYHLGALYTTPREFKAKLKAIDYGFTATLYLTPAWTADA